MKSPKNNFIFRRVYCIISYFIFTIDRKFRDVAPTCDFQNLKNVMNEHVTKLIHKHDYCLTFIYIYNSTEIEAFMRKYVLKNKNKWGIFFTMSLDDIGL